MTQPLLKEWATNFTEEDNTILANLLRKNLRLPSDDQQQQSQNNLIVSVNGCQEYNSSKKNNSLNLEINIILNQGKGDKIDDEYPLTIDFVLTEIHHTISYWLGLNAQRNIPVNATINFKISTKNQKDNADNCKTKEENDKPKTYTTILVLNNKSITFDQTQSNELSPIVGVFNQRINIVLEEYKTVRQEILNQITGLTNLFYYGIITLGIAFNGIQSILFKLNDINSQELFFVENFDVQYSSLLTLLWLLLVIFVPAICMIFVLKWLADMQSIGYKSVYLIQLERKINRAFHQFRLNHEKRLFNDYELNLEWENYIRRNRRTKPGPFGVFGNNNIFYIITAFCGTAVISQLYALYLFNGLTIKNFEPTFPNYSIFSLFSLTCFGFLLLGCICRLVYFQYLSNEEYFSILSPSSVELPQTTDNFIKSISGFLPKYWWCFIIIFLIILYSFSLLANTGIYSTSSQNNLIQEKIISSLTQDDYRKSILFSLQNKLEKDKTLKEQSIIKYFPSIKNQESKDIFQFFYEDLKVLGYFDYSKNQCSQEAMLDLHKIKLDDVFTTSSQLTNLPCLQLPNQILSDSKFQNINLTNANLNNATLNNVDFSLANLTSVDLNDADLTSANLTSADLSNAKIDDKTILKNTDFNRAKLIGVILTEEQKKSALNLDKAIYSNP